MKPNEVMIKIIAVALMLRILCVTLLSLVNSTFRSDLGTETPLSKNLLKLEQFIAANKKINIELVLAIRKRLNPSEFRKTLEDTKNADSKKKCEEVIDCLESANKVKCDNSP